MLDVDEFGVPPGPDEHGTNEDDDAPPDEEIKHEHVLFDVDESGVPPGERKQHEFASDASIGEPVVDALEPLKKIAELCTHYNRHLRYDNFTCNSQHFVLHVLQIIGMKPTFGSAVKEYLDQIKKDGKLIK